MDDKSHNTNPGNGACHGRPARRRRRRAPAEALHVLEGVPESRADLVARARRLMHDPGYPNEEMLWLIAQLLATRVEKEPVSY